MKLSIEVKIGTEYIPLVLNDKPKISVKRTNPMFTKQGSYSLPFQVPTCSINDYIFEFANRIELSTIKTISLPFRLLFEGINQFEGHCKIEKSTNLFYDCNLLIDTGNFASLVSGKKLTDLQMGGPISLFETSQTTEVFLTELSKCVNSSYPTYEYTVFPVYAPEFIETDYTEKCINEWDWENQRLKNSRYTLFVYVNTIVKYIFNENGYRIKENVFETDTELNKLVVLNNYSTTSQTFNLNKFMPDVTITDFIYNIQQRFCVTFIINDRLKEVSIKTNKDILTNTNFTDISTIADKNFELLNEKIYGYSLIQNSDKQFDNWNDLNIWDIDITVDDYVDLPDPTTLEIYYHAYITDLDKFAYVKLGSFVDEFGNPYQENYWEVIDYSTKNNTYSYFVHDIEKKLEVMQQNHETYNPGDLIFLLSEGNIYQNKGEEFDKISDNLATLSSGVGLDINSEVNVLPMETYTETINFPTDSIVTPIMTTERLRVLPNTQITGNYDYHKGDALTIFLLIYRGIQHDRRDATYWDNYKPASLTYEQWEALTEIQKNNYRTQALGYPFANNSIYDPEGEVISGATYSLSFYGNDGQYENFFKEYLHWYLNWRKQITRTIYLTPLHIHSLDFSNKYRIDNVNYLFYEIPIVYEADRITTEGCVLVTC